MTAAVPPINGASAPRFALLSLPSAIFFGIVLGAAAWTGSSSIVFMAGLVLAVIGIARGWSRWSVARLGYARRLSASRAFPGDTVTLSVTLDNRKLLPLTWVETADALPAAIAPEEREDTEEPGLGISTALLWYQRATRTRALPCRRRGWFPIGPARLTTGDIFGLFPRAFMAAPAEALIVYPRIHPVSVFGLPARHPLGEVRTGSRLFEDPSRLAGLRDYTPDVPMRRIHWKASARHQELQVKLFEPSATVRTLLFLDVDGFVGGASDGEPSEAFELAASVAASLAYHLIEARQSVGLLVNAVQADGSGMPRLGPARDFDHLGLILEALAKIGPFPAEPFPRFFDAEADRLQAGITVAVISAGATPEVIARLEDLRRREIRAQILQIGGEPPHAGVVPCRVIGTPEALRGAA